MSPFLTLLLSLVVLEEVTDDGDEDDVLLATDAVELTAVNRCPFNNEPVNFSSVNVLRLRRFFKLLLSSFVPVTVVVAAAVVVVVVVEDVSRFDEAFLLSCDLV